MKRFVGLDGIKGLALIAIVLYHCMQQRLPGGFYGVDVFFTVSGFLIAVSLIRSLAKTGSLNLVRYIPKRAARLYPALFLLIPVIVSVGWLFDHDIRFPSATRSSPCCWAATTGTPLPEAKAISTK